MTDDTRKPVEELEGEALDADFERVQEAVSDSGSDVAGAAFALTYVFRKTGIDLKRTPEENEAWAKRGAIKCGRAALKAVRSDA